MDAQEIRNVTFATARFKGGYSATEVDTFVSRVALEYQKVLDELSICRSELTQVRSQSVRDSAPSELHGGLAVQHIPAQALGILSVAQRIADQVQAEAIHTADSVIADATAVAEEKIAEATAAADQRREAADAHYRATESRIRELRIKHEELRTFLKDHLTTSLKELEMGPDGICSITADDRAYVPAQSF
ncbi:DivIVA domain-containing protein [Streptomyces sp. NPDC055085]